MPRRTTFRSRARFAYQDLFDNRHPSYIGDVGVGVNPKLAQRIKDADLILAIGPRLGEMTTSGYTLLDAPVPAQTLIHVHAGAEELGRVYQAQLMINSGLPQFASRLAMMVPIEEPPWRETVASARQELEAWQQRPAVYAHGDPPLDLWEAMQILSRAVPEDAIIANGAGNFATWAHRFWRYTGLRTQLAPTAGAMGYGVPAAIAAKIAAPERTVVALTGDGDFLMTGQELATAVQYGAGHLGAGVQQPDVRHDSHAPGARISRARTRHCARESGLCQAGASVRRFRCQRQRQPISSPSRCLKRWRLFVSAGCRR